MLINQDNVNGLDETSFGGLPVKVKGEDFIWPSCECCKGTMQFLGKISTDQGLQQVFMCQNDPGLCEEWDPNDGGNKVVITQADNLEEVPAPEGSETIRGTVYGAATVDFDAPDYDVAMEKWPEENNVSPRQVLGQLMGEPSWIQGEEVPDCDICKKPMRFVAQLEQGPDWETEMNFGGGGCAYLFDCQCSKSAKFLFQC